MNTGPYRAQAMTEELRGWLETQLRAGCGRAEILSAMRASGWSEVDAERALGAVSTTLTPAQPVPAAVEVPRPDAGPVIHVDGREVRVLLSMRSPRLMILAGLLSDAECEALIEEAAPRMARSETVADADGTSEVNPARTSDGMFFLRGESPLITRIEARISALLRWPVGWGEGLQVLRYPPGAQYRPHHDYFDPAHPGSAAVLARGGQRVGTLLMYLNTPASGGATVFPDIDLDIPAHRGQAVFFSYDRPHPVTRTLHGGASVIEGEKWVATKWLRERKFD